MDGAVVTPNIFGFPQVLTLEEARFKYNNAPIVKLEDMTLTMLATFMKASDNFDVLKGISPNCSMQDILYDNDHPASYIYIELVAMGAASYVDRLRAFALV